MAHVSAHMTMSLDGFVAGDDDQVGALFDWYDAGPIEVPTADPRIRFHLDEGGASMMRSILADVGALVCGRRLFDIAKGWDDHHPVGAPVVVVTHEPPPDAAERWPTTTFASDVDTAVRIAEQLAGPRRVVIASAEITGQALDLDLVDEVAVSLVPILLGSGRSYFGAVTRHPVRLHDPQVVPGTRATHLRYQVQKQPAAD